MLELALQVAIAPALVAAATLTARRFGQHTGGLVSAFPAIVGPVLLIIADQQGAAAAARAATGTLLGLVTLSAFALAYGRAAARAGWRASLAAGWVAAAGAALAVGSAQAGTGTGLAVAALAVGSAQAGTGTGLAVAALSLAVAHLALPRGARHDDGVAALTGRWDLPLRMALTALLVVALAGAARAFGPAIGGVLAALPVLASVLAVFTHRDAGTAAVADLLRGMLGGMAGFVAFCLLVAVLAVPAGVPVAFAAATVAAIALGPVALSAPTARRRRACAAPDAATG